MAFELTSTVARGSDMASASATALYKEVNSVCIKAD